MTQLFNKKAILSELLFEKRKYRSSKRQVEASFFKPALPLFWKDEISLVAAYKIALLEYQFFKIVQNFGFISTAIA